MTRLWKKKQFIMQLCDISIPILGIKNSVQSRYQSCLLRRTISSMESSNIFIFLLAFRQLH